MQYLRSMMSIVSNRNCSFCQQNSHTINLCNDIRIEVFEKECISTKLLLEIIYISNEKIHLFRRWLLDKYLVCPNVIKAFAIRKCGCTLRSNVQTCIDSIINYIFYTNQEDTNVNFIPFANSNINLNPNPNPNLTILEILSIENTIHRLLDYNFISIDDKIITTITEEKYHKNEICECYICFENYENNKFVKLNCGHSFCSDCIIKTIKTTKANEKILKCALCRSDIICIMAYSNEVKNKIDTII